VSERSPCIRCSGSRPLHQNNKDPHPFGASGACVLVVFCLGLPGVAVVPDAVQQGILDKGLCRVFQFVLAPAHHIDDREDKTMASNRMEHLADVATQCATHTSPNHPFGTEYGAFVRSRFSQGGWNFKTLAEAAQWVDQQYTRAEKDGHRADFSAAISDRHGRSISLYS
jgi:hypothetical protein